MRELIKNDIRDLLSTIRVVDLSRNRIFIYKSLTNKGTKVSRLQRVSSTSLRVVI